MIVDVATTTTRSYVFCWIQPMKVKSDASLSSVFRFVSACFFVFMPCLSSIHVFSLVQNYFYGLSTSTFYSPVLPSAPMHE